MTTTDFDAARAEAFAGRSLAHGGEGLGTMWVDQKARELLAEAGFGSVEMHQLEHGPFNAYYVVRP